MRRVLAAAVLVAFMPAAHAQDKGKSEFTHDAEYRVRYDYFSNPTAKKDEVGSTSGFDHRFKLDLNFRANEKVSGGLTLLHTANWGGGDATIGNYGTSGTAGSVEQNFMSVNQAFANWMINDMFSVKFGRMNYQIGDGTLMAINDWEAVPYAFEGALANYQAEFGRFQLFGFKYKDVNDVATAAPAAGLAADPEVNAYGLNFDLKTMPEWLKLVNAHVITTNGNASVATSSSGTTVNTTSGQSIMRYGAKAGFGFSMVDLAVWWEGMSGKYHALDGTAKKTDITASGNLLAAEVGVNLPNFMASRIYVRYHQDSGDKDESGSATDTDAKRYDGYFTQKHCSVGCMDLFGFGNMTFVNVGWTLKPTDSTDVGLAWWMLSRTEKSDGVTTGGATVAGDFGGGLTGDTSKSALGNEIDLWATHKYDGNIWTTARLGYFSPGDSLKSATFDRKDGITQVMLEGKFTF